MKHLPTCVLSFFVAGFCQETWQSRILYQWKNVSSPLASPKERIQSELLVDSNRGHVYLIGGTNSGPLSMGRELWRYNIKLSLWASIVPPAPTPSFRLHASTIDLKRDVFYVFGGISGPGASNSFWMFNLTTRRWLLKRTGIDDSGFPYDPGFYPARGIKDKQSYPSARTHHSMTVNEETGNVYVCCGTYTQESGFLSDFWEWEYESDIWILWSGSDPYQATGEFGRYGKFNEAVETNMPGSRWYTSMAFDSKRKNVYLFGGYGMAETSSGLLNDFWEWNCDQKMWKWIGGANTADSLGQPGPIDFPGVGYFPSARAGHAILIHTELNAMYVYGGTQDGDLWRYNFVTLEWSCLGKWDNGQLALSSEHSAVALQTMPVWRQDPAVALDRNTGAIYLFGGEKEMGGFGFMFNDFWAFNPTKCQAGCQLTNNLSDCQECPEGYYQPAPSIYACQKCPHYSTCNSTDFKCNPGYFNPGNQTCLLATIPTLFPPPSSPIAVPIQSQLDNWWRSNPSLAISLLIVIWVCLFLIAFLFAFLKFAFLNQKLDANFTNFSVSTGNDSITSAISSTTSSYSDGSSYYTKSSFISEGKSDIAVTVSNTLNWDSSHTQRSTGGETDQTAEISHSSSVFQKFKKFLHE